MKNKIVFVVILLLLGGCDFHEKNHIEEPYVFPKAGVEIGDSVKPDDEAGQIYFTCKNREYDIYMGNTFTPYESFSILSLRPLDVEDIVITVPIETSYVVQITRNDSEHFQLTDYLLNKKLRPASIQVSRNTFPYYIYQCYRDTDWQKMNQLYQMAVQNENKYEKYLEYRDLYIRDYRQLQSEDLPIFYVYDVTIWFGYTEEALANTNSATNANHVPQIEGVNRISETIHTINIQIEDEIYTQDIGEIRLHAETFPEELPILNKRHMKNFQYFSVGTETYPWGDGVVCEEISRFQANVDLDLTGVYLYENDMTVLGARILTKKDRYGKWEIHDWDMKSAFAVEQDMDVIIELILQDERMAEMEYAARVIPVISYQIETQTYVYRTELNLDRCAWYNYWFRYAVVFHGMEEEFKSYFNDYYTPVYESWKVNFSQKENK